MSENKSKLQKTSDAALINQYNEIMKLVPHIQVSSQNLKDLKQPSLLDQVESITTYGINCNFKDNNNNA